MINPISAFKNFVRPDQLKQKAADPQNLEAHKQFLLNRQAKGQSGPIYMKQGLSGKFLSSTPPLWGAQRSLTGNDSLPEFTANRNLGQQGAVGLAATSLKHFRKLPPPINQEEAQAHTKLLEKLVIDLGSAAANQKGGQANDDSAVRPHHRGAKLAAPAMFKPVIVAAAGGAEEPLPEFPSAAELNRFQRDLSKGDKVRPSYADVTQLVDHLNRTEGTISTRELPRGERNAADDLLSYITKGVTAFSTWDSSGPRESRPANVFGDRSFKTRLEAARFLFTETDFLKHLNPHDSAHYMGIYEDLMKEAKQARQSAN